MIVAKLNDSSATSGDPIGPKLTLRRKRNMDQVYVANFGEGNALWPKAKANSTIITIDNMSVHPFWQAGDRQGFIDTAVETTLTALGKPPSRPTAGRWYNLVTELQETEGDLWISRQGDAIWWTVSQAGELRQEVQPSNNPGRDGPEIWHIEKPCKPWSDKDQQGRPLRWNALHVKARDFLSTEATFQRIANDRGYADYVRAMVAGQSLDPWHSSALFKEKAAVAKQQGGRIYSPKERAAFRMAQSILRTVSQANGQTVERTMKEKQTDLSQLELEALLRQLIDLQQGRCALTGLPLGLDGECDDKEMLASPDRIDSGRHYTADNIQVVCWFINRWKGADDNDKAKRLLATLRQTWAEELVDG